MQLQSQIEYSRSEVPLRRHRHHPEQERGFVDDDSITLSHRSHRAHKERGHKSRHHDDDDTSTIREHRPKTALTADALESLSQASSGAAPSSYAGSQRPATSHRSHTTRNPPTYYAESAVSRPTTNISRRHTDFPPDYESQYDGPQRPRVSVKPRSIFDPEDHEPAQTRHPMPQPPSNVNVRSDIQQRLQLQRAATSPNPQNDGLAYGNDGQRDGEARDYYDPHLAYGTLPPDHAPPVPELLTSTDLAPPNQEREVQNLTSKLDDLLLEAKCVQHTATAIISSLQKNPDAMAAVALTLAELSNIITKVAPGALPAVMTALKTGSPAIFALLCSPQFLIAGGVAVGMTVVMFGGYKIIKKIQANVADKNEQKRVAAEAATTEEAIPFDPENYDDSVIESWRRGIADVEESAVEDEFITPKADKLRRERSKLRKREEREREGGLAAPSLSTQSSRSDLSQGIIRRKPLPKYLDDDDRSERSSRTRRTERTERSHKSGRSDATAKPGKKEKKEREKKEKAEKKPSALRMMFKGSSSVSAKGKEVALRV